GIAPLGPRRPYKPEKVGPAVIMGFSIALIIFSLLLMMLVLMHKGKGGGLSDMFGGGMQSSVGGSSVAERNLDRITVVVGLLWFVCIVVLGLLMKLD
ncbi:preprotein translocase subunit SecG, partial [Streptomyces sp. MnatMP-M27]